MSASWNHQASFHPSTLRPVRPSVSPFDPCVRLLLQVPLPWAARLRKAPRCADETRPQPAPNSHCEVYKRLPFSPDIHKKDSLHTPPSPPPLKFNLSICFPSLNHFLAFSAQGLTLHVLRFDSMFFHYKQMSPKLNFTSFKLSTSVTLQNLAMNTRTYSQHGIGKTACNCWFDSKH